MYNSDNLALRQAMDSLEVQKDAAKSHNRCLEQLWLYGQKAILHERESEIRKTQYEEVIITSEGQFNIMTRNLRVDSFERKLANFHSPELIKLTNLNDEEKYFLLKCMIGERRIEICVSGRKAGKASYLSKKIASAGCEVYAPSERVRIDYISKIWACLRNRCTKVIIVPSCHGWQEYPDGTVRFVKKEDWTWEDVKKLAK